jgi:hypothetical protein
VSSVERWARIVGGKIYLHEENDGWTFVRHGAEASEREISLGELALCYPSAFEAVIKSEKVCYLEAVRDHR